MIIKLNSIMTIKQLKEYIKDFPEKNKDGEDCEIWIEPIGLRAFKVTGIGLFSKDKFGLSLVLYSDPKVEDKCQI